MVFTGEETGVINAAEAAIATTIANGTGDTLSCVAREIAMGAIKIAVAVFEINNPTNAQNTKSTINTGYIPHPSIICVNHFTANSTPPVF